MLIKGKYIRILHVFNSESLCHQDHLLCYHESRSPIFNYMKQNDPTAPVAAPCKVPPLLGAVLPTARSQPVTTQGRHWGGAFLGDSWVFWWWFWFKGNWGFLAALLTFLSITTKLLLTNCLFFPSLLYPGSDLHSGWMGLFILSPLPNFHSLVFPVSWTI